VRPSNVYGPYDDFNPQTAQVIPSLIRRVLDGENPIVVWGDGSALRDFVYSRDVAESILRILYDGPVCDPLNLGSGTGVTIRQLAETIVETLSPKTEIIWDTQKPSGDSVRILSMDKTESILGKLPLTPLAEGIRQTADWFLQNRSILTQKSERHYAK